MHLQVLMLSIIPSRVLMQCFLYRSPRVRLRPFSNSLQPDTSKDNVRKNRATKLFCQQTQASNVPAEHMHNRSLQDTAWQPRQTLTLDPKMIHPSCSGTQNALPLDQMQTPGQRDYKAHPVFYPARIAPVDERKHSRFSISTTLTSAIDHAKCSRLYLQHCSI